MKLVTGGLGFIGNELVRQLIQEEVCIVDNRNRVAPKIDDLENVLTEQIDICDHQKLENFMRQVHPEVVFHLAAIHYIPECNDDPERAMRINVEGTLSTLRAAQAAGVGHFLLASSGAVYADSQKALTEDDFVKPVDVYGWTKLFCEELSMWAAAPSEMKVTVCRLFNNYGPRETNAHIIPEIIEQLKVGDVLSLGNIKPRRDYIHTKDCAKALRLLSQRKSTEPLVVNVASGQHASVEELISIFEKEMGRRISVKVDPQKFRNADKLMQVADISKLEESVDWSPEIDFRDGLRDLLKFEGLI